MKLTFYYSNDTIFLKITDGCGLSVKEKRQYISQ